MRSSLLFLSLFFSWSICAQFTVSVTVDSATNLSTTCVDIFGTPEVLYDVEIESDGWDVYDPGGSPCYNEAPRLQYSTTFTDRCNPPASVELCFRAYDNDGVIVPCAVFRSCLESVCMDVNLPEIGQSLQDTVVLSGGATTGELHVTVSIDIPPNDNDLPCGAIDLGTLGFGDYLGDTTLSNYNNLCATSSNEVQPADFNDPLFNDAAVWFRYTTGPNPSPLTVLRVISDPEGLGDPIDAELQVYQYEDCNASFTDNGLFFLDRTGNDAELRLLCPEPNSTYFVMVDGANGATEEGFFGLGVYDLGIPEGADDKCDAVDLGLIPEGGLVATDTSYGNFCAGNANEPFIPNFSNRASVWFSFVAPSSAHVALEGLSNPFSPLDIEFAVFDSPTDDCNDLNRIYSGRDPASFDETVELSCLDPGQRYWILVDGRFQQSSVGLFSLTVRDLGDIRPVTQLVDTVCAGGSVTIGTNIIYDQTGIYTDTLKIPGTNCDSIVILDLTVLDPLLLSVEQTFPAIGPMGTNGQGVASYSGGAGNYQLSWCTGETTDMAQALVAGANCCVTLVDGFGCSTDTCFVVDFVLPQVSTGSFSPVLCQGDSTGSISFDVSGSRPPYAYSWQYLPDPSLSGMDTFLVDGASLTVNNLPAGDYEINIVDAFFDTTYVISITEPDLLQLNELSAQDLSCFESADGSIEVAIQGGVGPYTALWPALGESNLLVNNLSAGDYDLLVTDANGCQASYSTSLTQPEEFIATAELLQAVSCFGGSDGLVSVTTNGQPIAWDWSSGDQSQQAAGLSTGPYSVLVTNQDNCTTTATIDVPQPATPLLATISEFSPISCADSEDGQLSVAVTGEFSELTYAWSDGQAGTIAANLAPAVYDLLVTNELGCTATASYNLLAPPPLTAEVVARDIRCTEPENIGELAVVSVSGGLGPYLFAIDDGAFSMDNRFGGLTAGAYRLSLEDALGCQLQINAAVAPPPELVVDIGPDLEIHLGDSTRLQAVANSDDLTYDWSIAPTVDEAALWVRPTGSGSIRLRVMDSLTLCSAEAIIDVLVDESLRAYVPSGFSPNDDGINDRFFPYGGNEVVSMDNFQIFNRYGGLVYQWQDSFSPNDPNIGWDGRINGERAALGVYVYSVRLQLFDGRETIVKGEITLVR
ncbi:MAG: gliding motility-associated C-terminal domain-containing protein [Bacteroidota bacterium]